MRSVLVLAVVATPAHADDGDLRVDDAAVEAEPGPDAGWSEPVWRSQLEAFGAPEQVTSSRFGLGPNGFVELAGRLWSNEDDLDPMRPSLDLPGRGWTTSIRAGYDLGRLHLGASASLSEVDTALGAGRHADYGASLTLELWGKAWISVAIGRRQWIGEPPLGESDATQVMFSFGTSFD